MAIVRGTKPTSLQPYLNQNEARDFFVSLKPSYTPSAWHTDTQ